MTAKKGDTVKIHYTGTLDDGTQFDSSEGRDPLEVKLGTGMVIPGFEEALLGMKEGEKKTVTIPADKAYGGKRDELIQKVPRDQLPSDLPLEVGAKLGLKAPTGDVIPATITEITDDTVTMDLNPPLAGKDLTFALEMVSIEAGKD